MKKLFTLIVLGLALQSTNAQRVSDFENISLSSGSYKNGSGKPVTGMFVSGNIELPNTYQTQFGGYWSAGWAYSNIKNDTAGGFNNLYASYAAEGNNASSNYAIGQGGSILRVNNAGSGDTVMGVYLTNGTYPALSMKNGDAFAKKFGGTSGNDSDYFLVTIKAWHNGLLKNDSVNFYLADFRFANNAQDYIQKSWAWVNLYPLGKVDSLQFLLRSSDNGQFGMNTPAFFCLDDLITKSDTADFENLILGTGKFWNKSNATLTEIYQSGLATFPSTFAVYFFADYWSSGFAISNVLDTVSAGSGNLYAAYSGKGVDTSSNYAVVHQRAKVTLFSALPEKPVLAGVYVTNTTYAALSMKNGDAFGKKFGGATGNDSDYFILTAKAYLNGVVKSDSVNFYLADYRFADNSKDYIVKDWKWMSLSALGAVDSVQFILSSSDNGSFGMNTPGFFAIDNLTVSPFTAVNNITKNNMDISVYPNPAKDMVIIGTEKASPVSFHIYDSRGLMVMEGKTMGGAEVHISSLKQGIYFIHLQTSAGTHISKLIKE